MRYFFNFQYFQNCHKNMGIYWTLIHNMFNILLKAKGNRPYSFKLFSWPCLNGVMVSASDCHPEDRSSIPGQDNVVSTAYLGEHGYPMAESERKCQSKSKCCSHWSRNKDWIELPRSRSVKRVKPKKIDMGGAILVGSKGEATINQSIKFGFRQ